MLDSRITTEELLSKTEDADLADAVIELQTKQNVYQAAIAAAERIFEMTLTDFWR
jgi:flagellar hook-associated protein 3 FlgL